MFTTYAASAGSGKTTHLVADYISLCFKNDSQCVSKVIENKRISTNIFHSILAVTFTNNAATEMKERIVASLRAFAFSEPSQFSGRDKAIFKMVVDELFQSETVSENDIAKFIKIESLELLRSIVYDYARFNLTTIDGFFQRVIRSSALLLNLNLNYSVQVELNEYYLKVIDLVLNDLQNDKALRSRVLYTLEQSISESGKLDIDKELKQALDLMYGDTEKGYEFMKVIRQIGPGGLTMKINEWKSRVEKIKKDLRDELVPHLDEINRIKNGCKGEPKDTFLKLVEKLKIDPVFYLNDVSKLEGKRITDMLVDASFFKAKKGSSEENANIKTHLIEIVQLIKCLSVENNDLCLMLKYSDKLQLLEDLRDRMELVKQQNNLFLLSEANTLVYENVENQDIPLIYEPIKYKNFFIDEFQDTSRMQWRNMKTLLENNSLSQGGDVVLYGDVKQAIYRFRNGDVNLFFNLIDPDRMKSDVDTTFPNLSSKSFEKKSLSNNFRSSRAVVDFNNRFFEKYSNSLNLLDYYEDVYQGFKADAHDGLVVACFEDKPVDKKLTERFAFSDKVKKYIENNTLSNRELQVLWAVEDAISRNYSLGDIAILLSGNEKGRKLAGILMECGYNVITETSLSLDASPAINVVIETMRYLLNPSNLVSQTSILHYLHATNSSCGLEQIMFGLKESNDFQKKLEQLVPGKRIPLDEWLTQPLFILLTQILEFYGLNQEKDPFVVDFCNLVLHYLQDHTGELADFLEWWNLQQEEKKMHSLTLPSDVDAITISTIHKSKGLEYPVVILPYSSSKGNNRSSYVWITSQTGDIARVKTTKTDLLHTSYENIIEEENKRNNIDEINLLYVAHTRASDMLYIVTSEGKEETDSESTKYGNILSSFVKNTGSETGDFNVENDEKYPAFFYYGNKEWKKPDDEEVKKADLLTPDMKLSLFKMEDVAALCEKGESEQQLLGTFVHDFLSKLEVFPQTMEEVEDCISSVEEDKKARLRQAFEKIIEDDKWKPYFAPGVKVLNEITILDVDGKEHRPDRVVFLDEEVMVLDYKTGQPRDSYQKQIDEYCNLLAQMGYKNVRGELIYV